MDKGQSSNHGHQQAHSEILPIPESVSFDGDFNVEDFHLSTETIDALRSLLNIEIDDFAATSSTFPVIQVGESSNPIAATSNPSSASVENVSSATLLEPTVVDPKRVERILANRQSAIRSRENKSRYIAGLEREVQTLQVEAAPLSAEFTSLQSDINSLTNRHEELLREVQTMKDYLQLQDGYYNMLKRDIEHHRMLTGETMQSGGTTMNFPTTLRDSR